MANIQTQSARDTRADDGTAEDAQSDLKRRARRRLVGATALALAAVIVLPMVMDREPRPPAQDIQVRIPSQDGGDPTARILAVKGPTPLPPAVAQGKQIASPVESDTPAEAKAESKTASKIEPKSKSETRPPSKPDTAAKADAKSASPVKPPEKPAEKPTEKKETASEAARATAALSGGGSGGVGGGESPWVVQLGAYKDSGNVKLLTRKLKELGVPSYTETFDSPQGPRTRVRAGPFATKEAAEKAAIKSKIVGVTGPVAPK